MKTKLFSLMLALLVLAGFRPTLNRSIVGKVTFAQDGSALPGVNVALKGTTHGTVTDAQGNYVISAPDQGGTLVFSFIGLKTKEVAIGAKNRIDVTLQADQKQLNEVVVAGYGHVNKAKRAEAKPSYSLSGQGAKMNTAADMAYGYAQPIATEQHEQFNTEE